MAVCVCVCVCVCASFQAPNSRPCDFKIFKTKNSVQLLYGCSLREASFAWESSPSQGGLFRIFQALYNHLGAQKKLMLKISAKSVEWFNREKRTVKMHEESKICMRALQGGLPRRFQVPYNHLEAQKKLMLKISAKSVQA